MRRARRLVPVCAVVLLAQLLLYARAEGSFGNVTPSERPAIEPSLPWAAERAGQSSGRPTPLVNLEVASPSRSQGDGAAEDTLSTRVAQLRVDALLDDLEGGYAASSELSLEAGDAPKSGFGFGRLLANNPEFASAMLIVGVLLVVALFG